MEAENRTETDHTLAEYVFSSLNFPFPVFLTTWHLTFSVRDSFRSAFRRCRARSIIQVDGASADSGPTGHCYPRIAAHDDARGRCQGH